MIFRFQKVLHLCATTTRVYNGVDAYPDKIVQKLKEAGQFWRFKSLQTADLFTFTK